MDLTDLRAAAEAARSSTIERDRLIRVCREAGASWGDLADAAGLTRTGVRQVAQRVTGTFVSIGYEGRTIADFLERLRHFDVAVLADVREMPLSRKKGFSKNGLSEALQTAGIEYEHLRGLGNPKENRDAFRAGGSASRDRFLDSVRDRGADDLDRLTSLLVGGRVAVMCFEADHRTCHRACVTDLVQQAHPLVAVTHA